MKLGLLSCEDEQKVLLPCKVVIFLGELRIRNFNDFLVPVRTRENGGSKNNFIACRQRRRRTASKEGTERIRQKKKKNQVAPELERRGTQMELEANHL